MSRTAESSEREIARLLVRYATAIDTKDWQLLGDCFTPSCRFTATGLTLDGVEAVVHYMRTAHAPIDGSHHRLTNFDISVDQDRQRARAVTYLDALIVRRANTHGPTLRVAAAYHDQLVFDASWRIDARRVSSLWIDGDPDVLGRADA